MEVDESDPVGFDDDAGHAFEVGFGVVAESGSFHGSEVANGRFGVLLDCSFDNLHLGAPSNGEDVVGSDVGVDSDRYRWVLSEGSDFGRGALATWAMDVDGLVRTTASG